MSRVGIKLRIVVLGGFAALVPVATAAAQAAPLRFDARLLPSGGVLAATAAGALAPVIFAAHLPHASCAPCDPAGLTFLDRGTVGDVRGGAATASDVALFATGGAAGLLLAAESRADLGIVREDLTVLAQAVGTASALTNWSKVAFHRPRPYRYVDLAAGSGGAAESGLSFPSGHTSVAFAAAFAYWSIHQRRGTARAQAPRIVTLVALAAATGVLRVVAREHFPTDVVAGAALGAAVGWTVPRLYPVRRQRPN
jgi:membrane-associated phospholipid phosphatase